jgi:hypothetical protein
MNLREISEEKKNSEALFRGNKIEAIKLYREWTVLGLKEAKDEIEAFEAALRAQFPDRFSAAPRGKGCVGLVAMLVAGIAVFACWMI